MDRRLKRRSKGGVAIDALQNDVARQRARGQHGQRGREAEVEQTRLRRGTAQHVFLHNSCATTVTAALYRAARSTENAPRAECGLVTIVGQLMQRERHGSPRPVRIEGMPWLVHVEDGVAVGVWRRQRRSVGRKPALLSNVWGHTACEVGIDHDTQKHAQRTPSPLLRP